jgi:anti-sigma regulatory factor (Ser/Thr protein kinase)
MDGPVMPAGEPADEGRPPAQPSPLSRQAVFEIPPGSAAPRTARQLLDDLMQLWDCDDPAHVAALLTSELVTNVVRHARTDLLLEVSLQASILRVAASDDDPTLPALKRVGPGAESGRGLYLIDSLARSWGVTPRDDGKTVWFDVVVTKRSTGPSS